MTRPDPQPTKPPTLADVLALADDLLGPALLRLSVIDTTAGLAMVCTRPDPTAVALLTRLHIRMRQHLAESRLPDLSRYIALPLTDNRLIIVQRNVGAYVTHLEIDLNATTIGKVMIIGRPRIAQAVDAALSAATLQMR